MSTDDAPRGTDDRPRRPTEESGRRGDGARPRDPLARPRDEADATDGGRAGRSGDRQLTRPDDEAIDRLLGSLPTVRVSRLSDDRDR